MLKSKAKIFAEKVKAEIPKLKAFRRIYSPECATLFDLSSASSKEVEDGEGGRAKQ